jgi:hypothetical protein
MFRVPANDYRCLLHYGSKWPSKNHSEPYYIAPQSTDLYESSRTRIPPPSLQSVSSSALRGCKTGSLAKRPSSQAEYAKLRTNKTTEE